MQGFNVHVQLFTASLFGIRWMWLLYSMHTSLLPKTTTLCHPCSNLLAPTSFTYARKHSVQQSTTFCLVKYKHESGTKTREWKQKNIVNPLTITHQIKIALILAHLTLIFRIVEGSITNPQIPFSDYGK